MPFTGTVYRLFPVFPIINEVWQRAYGNSWILDSQLRDTAKASLMLPDGSYCRKHSAVPFDSQDTFMQQSPHIPAAAAGAPKERAIG